MPNRQSQDKCFKRNRDKGDTPEDVMSEMQQGIVPSWGRKKRYGSYTPLFCLHRTEEEDSGSQGHAEVQESGEKRWTGLARFIFC